MVKYFRIFKKFFLRTYKIENEIKEFIIKKSMSKPEKIEIKGLNIAICDLVIPFGFIFNNK